MLSELLHVSIYIYTSSSGCLLLLFPLKATALITRKHAISSLIFSCSSLLDEILFYPENGGNNCLRNVGKGLPEQT